MVEGEISFGRFLNIGRRELRRDETLVRPGISFAPRGLLVAEGIRNRQVWTGNHCGRLRRRQVCAALLGLFARR
jgi:hypothetical protein